MGYEIRDGKVTIEVVEVRIADARPPTPTTVRALMKERGVTEEQVRRPGKYPKEQVPLRIVNDADRTITFLAYDCVAALDHDPAKTGKAWAECKDTRQIVPGGFETWGNFNKFGSPTGWFALFVNYVDPLANRSVQRPLGVYNLFNVRSPVVVIKNGPRGDDFVLDPFRSVLEE